MDVVSQATHNRHPRAKDAQGRIPNLLLRRIRQDIVVRNMLPAGPPLAWLLDGTVPTMMALDDATALLASQRAKLLLALEVAQSSFVVQHPRLGEHDARTHGRSPQQVSLHDPIFGAVPRSGDVTLGGFASVPLAYFQRRAFASVGFQNRRSLWAHNHRSRQSAKKAFSVWHSFATK
jgi:hypothetical protein